MIQAHPPLHLTESCPLSLSLGLFELLPLHEPATSLQYSEYRLAQQELRYRTQVHAAYIHQPDGHILPTSSRVPFAGGFHHRVRSTLSAIWLDAPTLRAPARCALLLTPCQETTTVTRPGSGFPRSQSTFLPSSGLSVLYVLPGARCASLLFTLPLTPDHSTHSERSPTQTGTRQGVIYMVDDSSSTAQPPDLANLGP